MSLLCFSAGNLSFRPVLALGACCLSIALTGCGDSSSGVAKTPEEAKQARDVAFATASAEAKAALAEAEAALKAQEDGKAFLQLNALSARQDLTAEQRGAAAQSMLSVSKKLDEAAARGDRDAAALLNPTAPANRRSPCPLLRSFPDFVPVIESTAKIFGLIPNKRSST